MRHQSSEIKRKILILLLGGLALGLTHSPKQYFRILNEMADDWKGVDKFSLRRSLRSLRRTNMLKEIKNNDGTISVVLTEKGRKVAEVYSLDDLKINKLQKWDGNWRVAIFDIPERIKKVREALRMHLRNLGFYELQKSVFVYPFPCANELNQILEFYDIGEYVRIISAHAIDGEEELIKHFKISV